MGERKKHCRVCGASEDEATIYRSGVHGLICDECHYEKQHDEFLRDLELDEAIKAIKESEPDND